jgi:hypothetical protein
MPHTLNTLQVPDGEPTVRNVVRSQGRNDTYNHHFSTHDVLILLCRTTPTTTTLARVFSQSHYAVFAADMTYAKESFTPRSHIELGAMHGTIHAIK